VTSNLNGMAAESSCAMREMMPDEPSIPANGLSRTGVITIVVMIAVILAIVVPAINHARESARRVQTRNQLKMIGMALHNYHDNFTLFPPGGVFNADDVAYHEWTTFLAPYLDASPWYNGVDFSRPWNDPEHVDLFRDPNQQQSHWWTNPSIGQPFRPDGLVFNHYAGSQSVFYRNSSVSPKDWSGTSDRLLVTDALGEFIPVGCPYGWRDVTLGLGSEPKGFGCAVRSVIQCLMGDGAVRELGQSTDQKLLTAMAGPLEQQPTNELVARPQQIPLLDISAIWDVDLDISGDRVVVVRRSPDGKTVKRGR